MIFLTFMTNDAMRADEKEIERLYNAYSNMIYRIAFLRTKSSSDSDDVLQEVFLRYIRRQPEFNDEGHCKAWFIRTAINCSNTLLSSAYRRHTVEQREDMLLERVMSDGEVYEEVLKLPVRHRTVIHLHYYEGYKITEIARLLGAKESTVKSWLFRAREELRARLKEDI